MKRYSGDSVHCAKCNQQKASTVFVTDLFGRGFMQRICGHCGYCWYEKPLDVEEKDFEKTGSINEQVQEIKRAR